MKIKYIYTSPQSNYWSLGKNAPGEAPTLSHRKIECHKGKGLVGDRFYGYKENYKGQVTFISKELIEQMKRELDVDFDFSELRRNIVLEGGNPLDLVEKIFKFGEVIFEGVEDCAPCAFWDKTIKQGSHSWLARHTAGGLRARVLSSGELFVGSILEV